MCSVAQSWPTLCDPVDCNPPGSSVHGMLQAISFPSPMHESEKWKGSRSVVSDPQRPHGLQPSRLLHPWDFPGTSTGVGCHCLSTPLLLHISFLFSLSFSSKALTAGAGIVSYFDHRDAPLRLYLWVIRNHVSWSPGLHVASTFTKFNGYPSKSVNKNSFGFFLWEFCKCKPSQIRLHTPQSSVSKTDATAMIL